MHKKISLLGSTGSIGVSSLQVIRHLGEGYEVSALAAHSNIDVLEQQIKEFRPKVAAVFDEDAARVLQKRVPDCPILSGLEGLKEVARFAEANFVISSMAGTSGLLPTVEAIKAGKDVALANKESLVSGGELVMKLVQEKGVRLLPVDSEHSALFQCLQGNCSSTIRRLILTASGGPFRNFTEEMLKSITVEQALNHPNWKMGPKVTIDSSTLMNKGLEVIEAYWLFGLPLEQIDVVIHPQSIIHSMIEYCDGSTMAQMGEPLMIVPIQYALTYPQRKPGLLNSFDFIRHGKLEFSFPDMNRFRCLSLAYEALKKGGSMTGYMNAANEVLVKRFIDKEIGWFEIGQKLEYLMERHSVQAVPTIESILEIDSAARRDARHI
jgi:1-deoxy-D-xylulose-5-phosphate reductoisomerase